MTKTKIGRENPNLMFHQKASHAQTAKPGLTLLLKHGVIEQYEWESNEREQIVLFRIWTFSTAHPPLELTPKEAVAFCRGAYAQYQRDQEDVDHE